MNILKTGLGILALALVSLPQTVKADGEGFYFGAAFGGMAVSDDTTSGATSFDTTFMPGYTASGFVGYELPLLPIRLEGEIAYRNTDLEDIKALTSAALNTDVTFPANGSLNSTAFMANAYTFLPLLFLEPYVGVGAGFANVAADDVSAAGQSILSGSDTVLAFQGILGIELDIIPGPLDFGVEYRYFTAPDVSFTSENAGADFDYTTHSVMLKVRYSM
jgi:opacity protein-like surface antigen